MPTHTRRVIRTAVRMNICVHAPIRSAGSLIRKTSFTSRSNRQRGGQASLTNMRDTGRWMKAEVEHVFRSAQNVWRLAPFHVRSERSPLHDVRQHAHANDAWTRRIACANSFSRTSTQKLAKSAFAKATAGQPSRFEGWLANRSGDSREGWWSQTGSNRRPPACKAGALPTELWPRTAAPAKREWWAWEDLNFRPHAYQARALTN